MKSLMILVFVMICFVPVFAAAQDDDVPVKPFAAQLEEEAAPEAIPEKPSAPSLPSKDPVQDRLNKGYDGARCFAVLNKAPYSVYGSFYTNFYMTSSGSPGRHQSNFKLGEGERGEFCSYGPFLGPNNDGLYLVLRTIIPIFSCKFRAEGELIIFGRRKAEGGTETWASCLN